MWSVLNSITGRKAQPRLPDYVNIDNRKVEGNQEIAECLNSYFVSVGPQLAKAIPNQHLQWDHFHKEKRKTLSDSFSLQPVTQAEVRMILRNCANKTSMDAQQLDIKLLKTLADAIVPPLTHICNLSFCSGVFPEKMKVARVLPLHKGGDKHDLSNYRPVSILPQFSKIIEKLFNNRLEES